MTATSSRTPSYPLPRPKVAAPSLDVADPATASTTPVSGADLQATRPQSQQHPSYYLSDRATTFLIRRTLCSQLADKSTPISELLPPLTSSNEVDLQLYAFIAIVIRESVYTWYSKITPDQKFVEEVVRIIAHCTRGLEQRLRKVDLESLIFDELPELLDAHLQAYRTAHNPLHSDPLQPDPRLIYHSLWPSPALSPVPGKNDPASVLIQKENEAAYRQLLVQGILAILLPTEDLENDCLTSLVGQIVSEMILGNGLGGKACEPWLLWEGIKKIAEVVQSKLPESKAQRRADKFHSDNVGGEKMPSAATGKIISPRWSFQKTFWLILQYAFFAFTTARFIIITVATSSSLPSRLSVSRRSSGTGPVAKDVQPPTSNITASSASRSLPLKRPILTMKIWTCASNLLDLDARMPWLSATLSMLQWFALQGPGQLGYTDGMIDKILSHTIAQHLLHPSPPLLPVLLRTARSALFPQNAPGPARRVPLPDEQRAIRRSCAETLLELIPAGIQDVYFGPGRERRVQEVEAGLEVLGDDYCNRHLMYGVVELVVVRLMPELAEKGVGDLLAERLS